MKAKLYITSSGVIKPVTIDAKHILGYNLLTEELVKVKRDRTIPMTQDLISIIGDSKTQYLIAKAASKSLKQMRVLLNVSERSVLRMKEKYDIRESEPALIE